MAAIRVAALREIARTERRVALVPEVAGKLVSEGFEVYIESGAGARSYFTDAEYAEAGAIVTTRAEAQAKAQIIGVIRQPRDDYLRSLRRDQVVVGLLATRANKAYLDDLAASGVTAIDLAWIPRTLSRTQSMDALSSQASVVGYRAAILAAEAFTRYLPMMITPAGTAKPAKVLVIGTGVAGLQAIATTKRLGAVVTGYDVRPASRGEVESLGAAFMTPSVSGAGEGGYARELTEEEKQAQRQELADFVASCDIVITTAQVPGRKPPILVTAETVQRMKPGSIVIDAGSTKWGGNVEGSVRGNRDMLSNGVLLVGAGNLASEVPTSASQMYARNIATVFRLLAADGEVRVDLSDEILDAIVVAKDGQARKEVTV